MSLPGAGSPHHFQLQSINPSTGLLEASHKLEFFCPLWPASSSYTSRCTYNITYDKYGQYHHIPTSGQFLLQTSFLLPEVVCSWELRLYQVSCLGRPCDGILVAQNVTTWQELIVNRIGLLFDFAGIYFVSCSVLVVEVTKKKDKKAKVKRKLKQKLQQKQKKEKPVQARATAEKRASQHSASKIMWVWRISSAEASQEAWLSEVVIFGLDWHTVRAADSERPLAPRVPLCTSCQLKAMAAIAACII